MGVLNIGDTDQKMGRALGVPMVLEEPFSVISLKSFRENQAFIARADLVLGGKIFCRARKLVKFAGRHRSHAMGQEGPGFGK